MEFFNRIQKRFLDHRELEVSLEEFVKLCKEDPTLFETPAQRMLRAIGPAKDVDTKNDPKLSRIFANKKIRVYETFDDFYGMEETIDNICGFFRHAAQGLEEKKQILYLIGPVGGGKSSLVERLKNLYEKVPFYTIKAGDQVSPLFESPFGLFSYEEDGDYLEKEFGIPKRLTKTVMSPWAAKRLREFDGDISKFKIVKVWPSEINCIGIARTEPGDKNNQDVSTLIGKVDVRKLEEFSQSDPDAYLFTGALNISSQGIMEMVEIFKAGVEMLNPLLSCTQDGYYKGTENFGAMPFNGIILAHSNESEWQKFRNTKGNEAFIDRVNPIKVPYSLRVSEEERIYEKLLDGSTLIEAACAPGTLTMLSQFSVLTRLDEPKNSNIFSKMEIYDGRNLKDKDPSAKSVTEYKDDAGVNEGMSGMSTRFAYKVLSKTFNYDPADISANPVHLMYILENALMHEELPTDTRDKYITFIKGILAPKYAAFIGEEIQKAYVESYDEYGQNMFDRYIMHADFWIQEQDYRDPDTGELMDRKALDEELSKIEKEAGIANPKDFRNEVVNFVLRAKAANAGKNPDWKSYEKMRSVIEKKMFASIEELLPVVTFHKKANTDEERKHKDFLKRMMDKGYTEKQVRLLVEWYTRYKKHS